MIIITDRTLADAGIDYQTAVGLLSPPAEELVVHVKLVLDEPPPQPQATEGLHAQTDDGRGILCPTQDAVHEGEAPVEAPALAPVLANLPTNVVAPPVFNMLGLPDADAPATALAGSRRADRATIGAKPPAAASAAPGARRLPEHGVSFGELRDVARALGAEAQAEPGGVVQLVSVFGSGVYPSVSAAAQALNARSFSPEPASAGLPAGWAITHEKESMPDLNANTPQSDRGYPFTRWTWVCRDAAGGFIVSDGNEDACYQQALSIAQTSGKHY